MTVTTAPTTTTMASVPITVTLPESFSPGWSRIDGITVDDECADILILLVAIANRYGISLDEAFRAKEARNNHRTWT